MIRTNLTEIVANNQKELLNDWVRLQMDPHSARRQGVTESQLRASCHDFLTAFSHALEKTSNPDLKAAEWTAVKDFLTGFSRDQASQGFTPLKITLPAGKRAAD